MQKTTFLTIYASFENLDVVKKTLPSIIEETKRSGAQLIVHDSSIKNRDEKWEYLKHLNSEHDFFLILSDNLSMAHARNMCLQLGQELYAPEYICMLEDDHGFKEGMIPELIAAMRKYYGTPSPNGLLYGLFSGCTEHVHAEDAYQIDEEHLTPTENNTPLAIGGTNSCFRCAPTSHWNNVLKGYDTDEYLISTFQTKNLALRNYNKGFTILSIKQGKYSFSIEAEGRGASDPAQEGQKIWDDNYAASDPRSSYRGKTTNPTEDFLNNKPRVIKRNKVKAFIKKMVK